MQTYVIFNTAVSLDGRVGKKGSEMVFSNKLDNYRVHKLRSSVDAVLVGVETLLSANPEVLSAEDPKKPVYVIVDSRAETPLDSRLLDGSAQTIVAVSKVANPMAIGRLKDKEAEVIVMGENAVHIGDLLWALHRRGLKRILLEGNGVLCRRMFNEGFVDELYVTVTPVLVGEGINLFQGELDKHVELVLEGILQYGDQVVLHYMVKGRTNEK
ncbi:MAG: dihydrofolate reductase family protein [Candidatus Altiarchaeota archaeon]|nr:dihydrofolate reductase family protein [Candidatus Altiarchaeota archaeon]